MGAHQVIPPIDENMFFGGPINEITNIDILINLCLGTSLLLEIIPPVDEHNCSTSELQKS